MIAELQDQNVDTVGHSRVRPTYQVVATTSKVASFTYGHKQADQGNYTFVVGGDGSTFPGVRSDGRAWVDETLKQLEEIALLPRNWDGEGGPPIDRTAMDAAERVLDGLKGSVQDAVPAPVVCPIRGGAFQFEWVLGDKYLEIEFSDKHVLYFVTQEQTPQGPVMISGEYPRTMMKRTRELLDWLGQG